MSGSFAVGDQMSCEEREAICRVLYHHPRCTPAIFKLLTGQASVEIPGEPSDEERKEFSQVAEELLSLHFAALRSAVLEVTGEDIEGW